MKGELKKLTIKAYKELKYEKQVDEYVVLFNPSTYSQSYQVVYQQSQGQGTTGSAQSFGRIKPQEYSFELVFDGTGVASAKKDVSQEIERFLIVAGKNVGDIHRPHYLELVWGSLQSKCVLTGAEITYNLFRADGYPLRAKVVASFAENIEDALRVAEEGNNSPDLTHWRVVKAGDTLPLLSYEIYGDPAYYIDVARVNGLSDFRLLVPGTRLRFPPLAQGASR